MTQEATLVAKYWPLSQTSTERRQEVSTLLLSKTLLRADDVLHALNKQSRKRVLPLSSDD